MVTEAGVVPASTFVAPSPKPPTNEFEPSLMEDGLSVFSFARNLTVATVPVPRTGCLASAAPTVMDAPPGSTVPDAKILGNNDPFVMVCASSFV